LGAVYVVLVYRTAWLSDDAFITLRTVSNLLNGYGLRWNIAERVQTFTHPLWMLWLTGAHAISGEPFYSTLYLSWLVSCAAVAVLFLGTHGGAVERALSLGLLIFSKAFVEYSSSGLENPLTHLWLACFVVAYLRRDARGSLVPISAILGLAMLTRLDTGLLYAPAWLFCLRDRSWRERAGAAFIVGLPIAGWLAFSLVYYGFLWPNTAYAKLGVGEIAGLHRLTEALWYFATSLFSDPLTLGGWLAIAVLMLRRRDAARIALIGGSALSLGYVVAIGGDFMSGRFFSAPFFMAVACLASSDALSSARVRYGALALAAALILSGGRPTLLTGADYGVLRETDAVNIFGVHDARAEFFRHTSLINSDVMSPARRDHPWTGAGHTLRETVARDPRQRVRAIDAIGLSGYYAGPDVHIVDRWALADPLLARFPASVGAVGHYTRSIPTGYLESLSSGRNFISDPVIADYYDQLSVIVRGALFTRERWRAIWAFNTGAYDERLRDALYADAKAVTARIKVTNVTDYPEVFVYCWNAFRQVVYRLDEHSHKGKEYEIEWRITKAGPTLISPGATAETPFEGLSDNGMFTLSAGFRASPNAGDTDIYELQYHYKSSGPLLTMLRNPLPASTQRFPLEPWRIRPVFQAIRITDAQYED
jgi:arabinofuranosyltransferase